MDVVKNPSFTRIDRKFLTKYENFNEFINNTTTDKKITEVSIDEEQTPHELIDINYNVLKNELQELILDKIDVLGLDMIYLQAKRWKVESTVSRPDIQGFVGSLVGKKALKGIFITAAKFSKEAWSYAESIDKRIILIDGQELTNLMFKYNVGVSDEEVYTIKKIDLDFFEE